MKKEVPGKTLISTSKREMKEKRKRKNERKTMHWTASHCPLSFSLFSFFFPLFFFFFFLRSLSFLPISFSWCVRRCRFQAIPRFKGGRWEGEGTIQLGRLIVNNRIRGKQRKTVRKEGK